MINVLQDKTLNVTEIEFALSRNDVRLSQASVSGTLSRLKEFRFVKCKQDGKYVYYTLNPKTIDRLLTFVKEIV